ncbi:MAG: hypothetical protein AAF617_04750 [Bacteroidota bacterium]
MVSFKELTIWFDPTKGRKQTEKATAVFNSKVKTAEVALKGFHIGFTDGDRYIYQQEIDLDILKIENNTVTVSADFLLRDNSGKIDDSFKGFIQCIVIANT